LSSIDLAEDVINLLGRSSASWSQVKIVVLMFTNWSKKTSDTGRETEKG
jgi:hypothetical protein